MAILKQKLNRKNDAGTYDEIHLKTDASNVSMSTTDETLLSSKISSMDTAIAGKQPAGSYAAANHNHSGVYQPAGSYAAANHNHSGVYQPVGSYATTAQLNEVKTSVSNGKSAVASAITDKGVSTSATASFDTMASNIRAIPTAVGSTRVIWIFSGGVPTSQVFTATKSGISCNSTYNSTFNCWKIELPGNNYTGTWTVSGSYAGRSDSKNVSVNTSAVDYYTTLNFIPLSGALSVGNTVTFDNKSFLVVHNSGNQWYLANSTIVENIVFGSNNTYSGSTLAGKCTSWLNNFSSNAQVFMNNVNVNGVTAKVFVPSFDQVNGGFSHYNINISANRICKLNGSDSWWWTSSPSSSGYVYYVNADGSINYNYPGFSGGFRPHICITY